MLVGSTKVADGCDPGEVKATSGTGAFGGAASIQGRERDNVWNPNYSTGSRASEIE